MYCILSNLIANNRAVQRAVENEVNTQYMTPTCICKSVISYTKMFVGTTGSDTTAYCRGENNNYGS